MKSILLSVKPKHVAKILNGEKTILIRKKFPKNYEGWVYIYCTKEDNLYHIEDMSRPNRYFCEKNFNARRYSTLCGDYNGKGKVVARFWCNRVDMKHVLILPPKQNKTLNENIEPKLKDVCLTKKEIIRYGNGENYYAYLVYITKLEIFDCPREMRIKAPINYRYMGETL